MSFLCLWSERSQGFAMEMEAGDRRGCTLSTQLRKRGQEGSNLATMGKTPCEDKGLINFCCSVADSCLTLRPHELQQSRLLYPSLFPRVCSNLCPLSQWCHPTNSFSVTPFSSHLQSFPASGSFLTSHFFTSGVQSIGVSASASVLPMNIQDWFPLGWTG